MKIDSLPPIVRGFASYELAVVSRSQKTVYQYCNELKNFIKFVYEYMYKTPCEDLSALDIDFFAAIKSDHIYEYLLYSSSTLHNQPAAIARKLSAIKTFFKYMTVKSHLLEVNPSKDIDAPKVKHALPKFLSLEESMALLNAVNESDGKNRIRDYCIITLFLNCGMRLNELCGINFSSFGGDFDFVKVLGKGSKERIIYLNDACKSAIREYYPIRKSMPSKDKDAFFVSSRGTRIYDKTVEWTVNKYLKLANLEYKHYSTHKLRHTAATLMYSTGKVDIRVIKDILGHEQLNTTQIYTHVSDKQMEDAARMNPLSGVKRKK